VKPSAKQDCVNNSKRTEIRTAMVSGRPFESFTRHKASWISSHQESFIS
jgi:hypothetical protein